MKKLPLVSLAILIAIILGLSFNSLQTSDEHVKASWAEVLNQYQRRADLIPNLVNTVKGYAAHEKELFIKVTQARASVGSLKTSSETLNDPTKIAEYQAAQGELTQALSRLLLVAENYPQLKADANFRELQAQLEGTENRITVARNRYIKEVNNYNVKVRTLPTNLIAKMTGHQIKPSFSVENEQQISKPTTVDFNQ